MFVNEFSTFQEIYRVSDRIMTDITESETFPTIEEISTKDNLFGYKVKYNVNEVFFYSPFQEHTLVRLYYYQKFEENQYNKGDIIPLLIHDGDVYQKS